jgi:pimeloyl-ACP methyl ester carboxylesterase
MAKIQLDSFAMNVDTHSALVPMDTVFMHGNLASNNWWKPALDIWKQQAKPGAEGRLIMGEWRGNGKSDGPQSEAELHPSQLADDYIKALRQMNVKKACIVGHSTGGLIALYALMKAPDLFDRAFLLDPVAATGVQFEKPMYDAFTQMSQDRSFCAAILGATIHANDPANPLFETLVDDAFNIAKINWHGVPNALFNVNILNDLSSINHPVLVTHGEHDTLLPKEKSVEMAERLANGKFMEIKGQGHSTNFENPQLFVQLVNDFLFNRN